MKKYSLLSLLSLFLIAFSLPSFATALNLDNDFKRKSGCFMLYNLSQNTLVTKYNAKRCAERISPYSTFKIPLALMAFDDKLINSQTVFLWDGKKNDFSNRNHDQTPMTWIKYSVIWVSQFITSQLGMDKIKHYLHMFDYGNQDFSGNKGLNDGLKAAWLGSSLKISADEQLQFLKRMIAHDLPVSSQAIHDTETAIYLETSSRGWKLYGKTGSGYGNSEDSSNDVASSHALQEGWFIGYVQKNQEIYAFVLNFKDLEKTNTSDYAGLRARALTKRLLMQMGVL